MITNADILTMQVSPWGGRRILGLLLVAFLVGWNGQPLWAQRKEAAPEPLLEVGVVEHLNEQLPLDLEFVDTMVRVTNILDSKQRLDFLYKLSENWFFIQRRRR